jgi:hypothetical protein
MICISINFIVLFTAGKTNDNKQDKSKCPHITMYEERNETDAVKKLKACTKKVFVQVNPLQSPFRPAAKHYLTYRFAVKNYDY